MNKWTCSKMRKTKMIQRVLQMRKSMNFSKRVVALKMAKNEFTHFLKNTIIHKSVLNS